MSNEVQWQEPPGRSGGKFYDYTSIIEQLKANPGKWALVVPDWKTSASPGRFRKEGCETTSRQNADGKTWSVYARFNSQNGPTPRSDAGKGRNPAIQAAIQKGTALTPPPAPKAAGGFTAHLASQNRPRT
ncbi:hypothetical protein ASF72_10745 [Arthrobacter sp. Leaf141]|uniref:hypothetical protein n=1 Tax=Arthrobacter sp. Leaf141 TaxID=1736273 RepID=UPI0006F36BB2|nr:hypothetical protein [Arthrobacter sp. Leaf141]KQR02503.1 hypothetical protein ASF72_10745 [Arthrobacter sp. Leaf141]